jgi:hypothetical protein
VPGASIAHRMPGYACSDPVLTKKKTEYCFYSDAIREYERAAKKKNDPTGAYADETLPTLRKYLDTAQSLMGNFGSGKR